MICTQDPSLGIVVINFSIYVAESFLLETCFISFAWGDA